MNFVTATESFENWLRSQCDVHEPDLEHKHTSMRKDAFEFFRATYYRWAQLWPTVCQPLADAPKVLAVGDIHIENFGTWRDSDARLVWGVNDFDEAEELPYTHDLVRLATSLRMAKTHAGLSLKFGKSCRWLLESYRETLEQHGEAFVLEENHTALRAIALAEVREPVIFWKKFADLLEQEACTPPEEVQQHLRESLPAGVVDVQYRRREKAGVGSLGKPRYLLLGMWAGGRIAREAKARTPASTAWLAGHTKKTKSVELLGRAVRCQDPHYNFAERWVIRRLAPHCVKIEIEDWEDMDVVRVLIQAMGSELANMHLGTPDVREAILNDLTNRDDEWLENAARTMADVAVTDWKEWKNHPPRSGLPSVAYGLPNAFAISSIADADGSRGSTSN